MSETTRLSPMTNYYLRKFIEDRQATLTKLLPELAGDITLERLFERMKLGDTAITQQVHVIESLVAIHKQMTQNTARESTEAQRLDQRLLLSLGITGEIPEKPPKPPSVSVIQDCLDILNTVQNKAVLYLGKQIGTKYLLETRPSELWCQKFKIEPKTKISYQGHSSEKLTPEQVRCFESWINQFSSRCGQVIDIFTADDSEEEALF